MSFSLNLLEVPCMTGCQPTPVLVMKGGTIRYSARVPYCIPITICKIMSGRLTAFQLLRVYASCCMHVVLPNTSSFHCSHTQGQGIRTIRTIRTVSKVLFFFEYRNKTCRYKYRKLVTRGLHLSKKNCDARTRNLYM